MLAEIISIGDEILIGQIVNINAVWMSQELNNIGVSVKQITSVSDDKMHIKNALNEALNRVDIILITGGLGPTKDDITKNTLCEYFNVGLREEHSVLDFMKENFAKRNIEFLPVHASQALILENSELLFNYNGTAPGMWIEHFGKVIVSMPGVPFEMKGIMKKSVLPKLKERFRLPLILHRTVVTIGLPESTISSMLHEFELKLPSNIKLAYLPNFGMVRLRLSGIDFEEQKLIAEMQILVSEILQIIEPSFIAATDDLRPEQIVGNLLKAKGQTVSIAESCTGGFISHQLTTISGSSNYFQGSVIAYANSVKINQLGVSKAIIETHGAVSEECAIQMAEGAKKYLNSDYALSTTGIAGPEGGSAEKPVGLVWIAVSGPKGTKSRKLMANGERFNIIERASLVALDMLRRAILEV